MRNLLQVFKGKRVFVTGHNGFKGAWLTLLLTELGAEVTGYSLPDNESNSMHFTLLDLSSRINSLSGDMRDFTSLNTAINNFRPEIVFHMAAQPLVKESYADPIGTYSTNVMGAVHLLEAVRQCESIRSLVYITTDKCYENKEWIWGYRESDQLGGHDPYSASKAAAEIVFSSHVRSFFHDKSEIGMATTRAGNVIGGGDWSENRIIPDCIRAFQDEKPIELRSPAATRPWQHVLEPISGYILLASRLLDDPKKYSGAWNFGPSVTQTRSVKEMAEKIVEHFGRGEIVFDPDKVHEHEAKLLQLNCDKAHLELQWAPRWDVEKTLKETALWYKSYLDGEEMAKVTRNQLYDYFNEL
jgi:CDP-glucose 4,6-dehydratase